MAPVLVEGYSSEIKDDSHARVYFLFGICRMFISLTLVSTTHDVNCNDPRICISDRARASKFRKICHSVLA